MLKGLIKKSLAVLLASTFALSAALPVFAAAEEARYPDVVFKSLGLGTVPNKYDSEGSPYHCIQSDLFYIEYPWKWAFGTDDLSPLTIFYNNMGKDPTSVGEFQDFEDSKLTGDIDTVAAYVEGGGINSYIEKVIGKPVTKDFQFVCEAKEEPVLVYKLLKGGVSEANVVIWTFGKLSIRSTNQTVYKDSTTDYGSVHIFPVWDDTDFSTEKAINSYVNSGELTKLFKPLNTKITWTTSSCKVNDAAYVYCEGKTNDYFIGVYIPVTPKDKMNWAVSFSADKKSGIARNAYAIREEIIKTFKALK